MAHLSAGTRIAASLKTVRSWCLSEWEHPRLAALGLTALVIAVVGVVLFPGVYTPDAMLMVGQAEGSEIRTNWHPPLLVAVWGLGLDLTGSAVGLWLVQVLLFGVGLYLLLRTMRTRMAFILAGVFVLGFAPMILLLTPLWKDSQLAIVFLIALVMSARPAGRWLMRVVLAFLAIALITIRFNSFPLAILPIWTVVESLRTDETSPTWIRRFATHSLLCSVVGTLLLAALVNQVGSLTVERTLAPQNTVQAWDLVGIEVRGGDVDLDARALRTQPCDLQELRNAYTPATSDFLVFPADSCIDLVLPVEYDDQSEDANVNNRIPLRTWLAGIAHNPTQYLRHRVAVAGSFLGLSTNVTRTASLSYALTADSIVGVQSLSTQKVLLDYLEAASRKMPILFMPLTWLAITTVAVVYLGRRNPSRVLWVSYTVVVANLLLAIVASPASDLRYSFPLLASILFFGSHSVDTACRRLSNTINVSPARSGTAEGGTRDNSR